jgi:putrescine transport system substrate-binding protein
MLDEPAQVFPAVLHYLKLDPNSSNPADYREAMKVLKKIRGAIRQFSSSGYIDELANGDLCMVYGFSGDVMIARSRAPAAFDINYFIPKGGAPLWFDVMAVPKDAPHADAAMKFINYIETPQVHAAITNTTFYPNANQEARRYVVDSVVNNPMIYPSPEVWRTLFVIQPQPVAILRLQSRLWADLKSSHYE